MSWIILATLGQFLNAIVAIMDKYIVSDERILPRPFVFAFYSCLITGGWIAVFALSLIPGVADLGVPSLALVQAPDITIVALSFLSAYTFFIALVSMYDALRRADAAVVIPVIGAAAALASFVMSYLFLDTRLTSNFIWGVLLLAVGSALVAQTFPQRQIIIQVIHSGIFFALHYITMKGLFDATNFSDGFFWSRVGLVLFTLSLLLVPVYWQKITEQTTHISVRAGVFVIVSKIIAGIASFLLLLATDWGEVTVVQSLEAVKFLFIVALTALFARWLPNAATEQVLRPREIVRQIMYIIIITVGFVFLFT